MQVIAVRCVTSILENPQQNVDFIENEEVTTTIAGGFKSHSKFKCRF